MLFRFSNVARKDLTPIFHNVARKDLTPIFNVARKDLTPIFQIKYSLLNYVKLLTYQCPYNFLAPIKINLSPFPSKVRFRVIVRMKY